MGEVVVEDGRWHAMLVGWACLLGLALTLAAFVGVLRNPRSAVEAGAWALGAPVALLIVTYNDPAHMTAEPVLLALVALVGVVVHPMLRRGTRGAVAALAFVAWALCIGLVGLLYAMTDAD